MAGEPIRSLVVFPNPTQGLLELKDGSQGYLKLYDATGRLIDRLIPQDSRLDLSGCSPGVYFLKGPGPDFKKIVVIE